MFDISCFYAFFQGKAFISGKLSVFGLVFFGVFLYNNKVFDFYSRKKEAFEK